MTSFLDYRKAGLPPAERAVLREKYAISGNGLPLIGVASELVDQIGKISACGIDGLLLTWIDYQGGIRKFGETLLPLLEQSGLRRAGSLH